MGDFKPTKRHCVCSTPTAITTATATKAKDIKTKMSGHVEINQNTMGMLVI